MVKDRNKLKIRTKKCGNCGYVVKYTKDTKPTLCNKCNSEFWFLPELEARCFKAQKLYLDHNRDSKYLDNLYRIMIGYAKGVVINTIKNKIAYNNETINEKAHDLVCNIIEYYLRSDKWYIQTSFGAYLYRNVKEVLYNRKRTRQDRMVSLNSVFESFSEDNKSEMIENLYKFGFSTLSKLDKTPEDIIIEQNLELVGGIGILLENIYNKIAIEYGYKTAILSFTAANHLLNKKNIVFMNKYFDYCGNIVSKLSKSILYSLYQYIQIETVGRY